MLICGPHGLKERGRRQAALQVRAVRPLTGKGAHGKLVELLDLRRQEWMARSSYRKRRCRGRDRLSRLKRAAGWCEAAPAAVKPPRRPPANGMSSRKRRRAVGALLLEPVILQRATRSSAARRQGRALQEAGEHGWYRGTLAPGWRGFLFCKRFSFSTHQISGHQYGTDAMKLTHRRGGGGKRGATTRAALRQKDIAHAIIGHPRCFQIGGAA